MNLVQIVGRHCRLKAELTVAVDEVPCNMGRIDRLARELDSTTRQLSAAQAGASSVVQASTTQPTHRLAQPCSTHAWLGGFAARLLQLNPSMSVGAAVRYAVMSIHHAAQLDLCRAAELLLPPTPTTKSSARPIGAVRLKVRGRGLRSLLHPRLDRHAPPGVGERA